MLEMVQRLGEKLKIGYENENMVYIYICMEHNMFGPKGAF